MVQVAVSGGSELQGAEADVVESLVVQGEALVGVLHELVDGESGIVGLHHGIRHLRGRDDGERGHHTIGVLLADLGDQQSSHTRACSTTHRVSHLEALEAVARLGFLADYVKNRVNQLSSFGVVSFCPVVSGSGLAEHEVVRTEELAEWSGTDRIHRAGLQVHQDSTRNVSSTSCLIEVNTDSLQLKIRIAVVSSSGINTVFVRDNFPELCSDLVTVLTALNVNNFSHFKFFLFLLLLLLATVS